MYKEHVDELSTNDLRTALKKAGLQNGPITESTEVVYRASLLKYLMSLEYEDKQTLPLNSSNSDVEYVDSGSGTDEEGDLDSNEASEIPVHQALTDVPTVNRSNFTPIRWNPKLKRYESVYGESDGALANKGNETHSKGIQQWLLLLAVAVMFLAIVIAVIFLSGERDPYKSLEDAASHIKAHG